jgi:uncharacterized protein
VVKAGDIVRVKVMEVDQPRKRIGLSMRLSDKAEEQTEKRGQGRHGGGKSGQGRQGRGDVNPGQQSRSNKGQDKPVGNNAFAAAFANARKGK